MKDSMRFVFEETELGWKNIFEAQSFSHACQIAKEKKEREPNKNFCVNTK